MQSFAFKRIGGRTHVIAREAFRPGDRIPVKGSSVVDLCEIPESAMIDGTMPSAHVLCQWFMWGWRNWRVATPVSRSARSSTSELATDRSRFLISVPEGFADSVAKSAPGDERAQSFTSVSVGRGEIHHHMVTAIHDPIAPPQIALPGPFMVDCGSVGSYYSPRLSPAPKADDAVLRNLLDPAVWRELKGHLEEYRNDTVVDSLAQRRAQKTQAMESLPNVKLVVDVASNSSFLDVTGDVEAGEEITMNYGSEFWNQHFGYQVFSLPANSNARDPLKSVRWIESLLHGPDDSTPFPSIKVKISRSSRRPVLVDMTTMERALDTAAVAFALREAVVDREFGLKMIDLVNVGEGGMFSVRALRKLLRDHLLSLNPRVAALVK